MTPFVPMSTFLIFLLVAATCTASLSIDDDDEFQSQERKPSSSLILNASFIQSKIVQRYHPSRHVKIHSVLVKLPSESGMLSFATPTTTSTSTPTPTSTPTSTSTLPPTYPTSSVLSFPSTMVTMTTTSTLPIPVSPTNYSRAKIPVTSTEENGVRNGNQFLYAFSPSPNSKLHSFTDKWLRGRPEPEVPNNQFNSNSNTKSNTNTNFQLEFVPIVSTMNINSNHNASSNSGNSDSVSASILDHESSKTISGSDLLHRSSSGLNKGNQETETQEEDYSASEISDEEFSSQPSQFGFGFGPSIHRHQQHGHGHGHSPKNNQINYLWPPSSSPLVHIHSYSHNGKSEVQFSTFNSDGKREKNLLSGSPTNKASSSESDEDYNYSSNNNNNNDNSGKDHDQDRHSSQNPPVILIGTNTEHTNKDREREKTSPSGSRSEHYYPIQNQNQDSNSKNNNAFGPTTSKSTLTPTTLPLPSSSPSPSPSTMNRRIDINIDVANIHSNNENFNENLNGLNYNPEPVPDYYPFNNYGSSELENIAVADDDQISRYFIKTKPKDNKEMPMTPTTSVSLSVSPIIDFTSTKPFAILPTSSPGAYSNHGHGTDEHSQNQNSNSGSSNNNEHNTNNNFQFTNNNNNAQYQNQNQDKSNGKEHENQNHQQVLPSHTNPNFASYDSIPNHSTTTTLKSVAGENERPLTIEEQQYQGQQHQNPFHHQPVPATVSNLLPDVSGPSKFNYGFTSPLVSALTTSTGGPTTPISIPPNVSPAGLPSTTTTDATSIPGVPGIDYPILSEIPFTGFDCQKQRYKGFFADIVTKCQAWHYCDFTDGHSTFLCPNGTLFSQVLLTCDWWFNVDCSQAQQLYVLNERLYRYIKPPKPSFPEDFHGPQVDLWLSQQLQLGLLPKMKKKVKDKVVIQSSN